MNNALWKTYDCSASGAFLLEFFQEEPFVFLLESSSLHAERGRYSFIGFDPFDIFSSKGKNSLKDLRRFFELYRQPKQIAPSPFGAGLMGYLAYDFGLSLENISLGTEDDLQLPDCFFGFYDCVLTIDHFTKKLYVYSTGLPEKTADLRRKKAEGRLKYVEAILCQKDLTTVHSIRASMDDFLSWEEINKHVKPQGSQTQYVQAVEKALNYIAQGDIYQVNLAQRFSFQTPSFQTPKVCCQTPGVCETVEIYKNLRQLSPSHFSAYWDCGKFQIMSSSPERFLQLKDGVLQTRPMKGTRPRGSTSEEDLRFKEELLKSDKDQAELLMITDLERNDLGRVCEYGSVKVQEMRTLEEYKTVFQATSNIEGVLQKGKDAFDVLSACFPGGSITGCPKIRAMEIIEELEPVRRGIYTGAMGYISFTGEMDFNILIRTLLAKQNNIYFHVGSGIVADSDPEQEYQETLVKAKALGTCLCQSSFSMA